MQVPPCTARKASAVEGSQVFGSLVIPVFWNGNWYDFYFPQLDGNAAEYWTHYAIIFRPDPDFPSEFPALISVVVNGTFASERVAFNAPILQFLITSLLWQFESTTAPFSLRRNFRVWNRALSASEVQNLGKRRIWGGVDDYATTYPNLKINIPFDFGAPGTEFNASTPLVNDVDCTPVSVSQQTGAVHWQQSDSGFCSTFLGGVPPAGATACSCERCLTAPGPATSAIQSSRSASCSELQPDLGASLQFRVWNRALSASEVQNLGKRRIWGGVDDYATTFPNLKINIPFDFGAPGTEFNASTPLVNDVDCTPVSVSQQTGALRKVPLHAGADRELEPEADAVQ
eukprot:tig00020956_g16518.t1